MNTLSNPEDGMIGEIRKAIKYLSYRDKLIVALYYSNNLTFEEIDYVLSLPAGSSKKFHSEILIAIKAWLNV